MLIGHLRKSDVVQRVAHLLKKDNVVIERSDIGAMYDNVRNNNNYSIEMNKSSTKTINDTNIKAKLRSKPTEMSLIRRRIVMSDCEESMADNIDTTKKSDQQQHNVEVSLLYLLQCI